MPGNVVAEHAKELSRETMVLNIHFACTLDRATCYLGIKNESDGFLPPGVMVLAILRVQQFIADMGANVYCTVIQEEMEAEKKKESDAQVPSAVAEETGGDAVAEVVDDKKKDDV